jgi:plastocyanin
MRGFVALATAGVVVLSIASCGDNGGSTGDASVADLLVLGEDIRFDAREYALAAGAATVECRNVGSIPHNLVFETGVGAPEAGNPSVTQGPGESVTYRLELESGSYAFYCSVAGHREAGMEAVLNVT